MTHLLQNNLHPATSVIDSTKLKDFLDCPRKYFFSHILGWQPEVQNLHLRFGIAWHKAMEHIMESGNDDDTVLVAHSIFMDEFMQNMSEEEDALAYPKNSVGAMKALATYSKVFKHDQYKTIFTEIAGTVPVGQDNSGKIRVVHFKMDNILQNEHGQYTSLEHKTGSANNRQWRDQWILSPQVSVYYHVLNCQYDPTNVDCIIINGVFFKKTGIECIRVPIKKSTDMMNSFLYDINHWFDMIDWNIVALQEDCSDSDSIMRAFPRNPQSCTKYFGCPFLDICSVWNNPLQRADQPPPGFIQRFWDPREAEQTAKKVIKIGETNAP